MKIEATELRLGNTIQRISTGALCTVNWGIIKDIESGNDRDYQPIILNDTLFKAIGAKQDDWMWVIDAFGVTINCDPTGGVTIAGQNGTGVDYPLTRYFDYFHQLQNLYFFLTGKELQLPANA